ncbi:TetR/AcrR family transcriptional regulator [Saccharibacillus sacchari]|uniref:TetR/AcrR family transcriptional regulator n=1 Tax=Saccharibacillus sacchari TaxID=456493 RepID=A0ACC6PF01_9BACL
MQSKKEQVKQEIETAALHVFFEQGYIQARMSDIAKRCGISTGNIYTYFVNKEELFYTVVPSALVDRLNELLVQAIRKYNERDSKQRFSEVSDPLLDLVIDELMASRQHIVILLEKSTGTLYEGYKERLIQLMIDTKQPYIKPGHKHYALNQAENDLLMRIVSASMVDMFLNVLKSDLNAESRFALLQALNVFRLSGVNGLNE